MVLIDVLLNIACLLLWLHWRSLRHDPFAGGAPATLAGTLRRAEAKPVPRWQLLVGIAAILLLRAWIHWQIGSAALGSAKLDVGPVVLSFRADVLWVAVLHSALSFARVLLLFYTWLIVVTLINKSPGDQDVLQKLIRLQLGRVGHLPWPVLLLLPAAAAFVAWHAVHPLLIKSGSLAVGQSYAGTFRQGVVIGLFLYTSLKFVLPPILFVYMVLNYVYLGSNPLFEFITNTARRMLAPLRFVPLRFSRFDFSPLVAATLILLLLEALPNYLLTNYPALRSLIWWG